MRKITLLSIFLILLFSAAAHAEVVTQDITYNKADTPLVGYLAYDGAISGKRPGVLVVHEWWGLNDYAKMRARKLAEMGYVAFAVDMYGDRQSTTDPKEAMKLSGHVRSNDLMRARAKAGLEVLKGQEMVDTDRIAAIGFCFGGTTVIELAYAGADLKGVVSFHGGLTQPKPEDGDRIEAAFLILHGAEDPHIKQEDVTGFWSAMDKVGADWHLVAFGGAVHSFSNPGAGDDPSKGIAYDPKAEKRSWNHMKMFFEEIFGN